MHTRIYTHARTDNTHIHAHKPCICTPKMPARHVVASMQHVHACTVTRMYVHAQIYTYTCTYTCAYSHTNACILHTCAHTLTCMHACTHVHTHTHAHSTRMHTHICTRTRTHTHTHTHTHISTAKPVAVIFMVMFTQLKQNKEYLSSYHTDVLSQYRQILP